MAVGAGPLSEPPGTDERWHMLAGRRMNPTSSMKAQMLDSKSAEHAGLHVRGGGRSFLSKRFVWVWWEQDAQSATRCLFLQV